MSDPARVLFVTSNGTGLGHLTRSMAIAGRLDEGLEPLFVTFSAGAPVVAQLGYPVEYLASYDRPGAGNDIAWTLRSRARLEAIVAEAAPRVVVFDGTHPYERLLPSLRASGASLVWCRRAMWRADSDTAPLWRTHLFDAVLEPGEYAAAADRGPTSARRSEAHAVAPIVLTDREHLLGREDAERQLGLAPGRTNVLVQLGQGSGVREANLRCLHHLAGRDDVQVAAVASTLAALGDVPDGVVRLESTYPIARYFAAFDAAVAASGYNAFHELLALGVPSLLVPMARQTDDQAARARWARETGVALACDGPEDPALEHRLDELLDPARRRTLEQGMGALQPADGAARAARWLGSLATSATARRTGGDAPASRRTLGTRLRRAWIFVSSVPATARRIGRQLATRRPPRVIVLAFGLEGERLEGELQGLLGELGERPERMLVVTDRLEFEPLLRAGVGFEHVPAEDSRQARLAGGPGERFRERRVELALAGRGRRARLISLTDR